MDVLHLLIKVLTFFFMLEIRDETLDSVYYFCLCEVILVEDAFKLGKELVDFFHRSACALAHHTKAIETFHINLLAWNVELLKCLLASGVRFEVNDRIRV